MRALEELREMLFSEVEGLTRKGEITSGACLDMIDKLTHSIKSIDTIMAMEGSGYSQDSYSYARGGNRRGGGYGRNDGNDGYSRNYPRDYGYNDGYSRDEKQDMVHQLERMMQDAPTEKAKEAIRKAISQIEEG